MTTNTLAIDRGTKKIGLAWKTSDVSISFPLGYLMNNGAVVEDIAAIVAEKNITEIIIGKPLVNPEKKNTKQQQMCLLIDVFAEQLKAKISPAIICRFVDEHYSSAMAGATLGDFSKHVGEDVVAAMKLLEYL